MKHFLLLCLRRSAALRSADGACGKRRRDDAGLSYTESTDRLPNPHMNYPSHALLSHAA